MAKITDVHVRRLFRLLEGGATLRRASHRAGIDRKTARRYWRMKRLPSEIERPLRTWRTREDPFVGVWAEVEAQLTLAPRLQAKTLFGWLGQKYPGRFQDEQLRTLQRRVQAWRALHGPGQEVYFSQVHHPGRLCASDFTHLSGLDVTMGGQRFEHLAYHFVLTYSNWESITLCFSESFASLSEGLQNALGELGGVPERHRSDRLSSAVNNLSDGREFTERYQGLLSHYGLVGEKINARQAHENGDVESSHGHFKGALDQALWLRGSRDFVNRESYTAFVQEVVRQRNAGRWRRLAEERQVLRPLPSRRLDSYQRVPVRVSNGSLIRVHNNVYSVHSRLIGALVEVHLHAEDLEVWYGQTCVARLPRLRGRCKQRIDYRHVIDTLVRKPGALENYRYREELFPTSRFRLAYDELHEAQPARADAAYLRILHLAAHESEAAVDEALRVLLASDQPLSLAAVEGFVRRGQQAPQVTDVVVEPTDLASFDVLLTNREVVDDEADEHGSAGDGSAGAADGVLEGAALADDAGVLCGAGAAGAQGDAVVRAVPVGAGAGGVRSAACAPDRAATASVAVALGEGPGAFRVGASAGGGGPAGADAVGREFCGASREPAGVWQVGFGQDAPVGRAGPGTDSPGPHGVFRHVQLAGAGVALGQARVEVGQGAEAAEWLRGVDPGRPGLCAAEPGGDGSVVHALGGALRTWQCALDEQLAVLEVGDDFQGPADDRGGDRSASASQRDLGAEHLELPFGTGQEGEGVGECVGVGTGPDIAATCFAAGDHRGSGIRRLPARGPCSAAFAVAARPLTPLRKAHGPAETSWGIVIVAKGER